MPITTLPLPEDKERAAIEVLRRIYSGHAPHRIMDDCMEVEWVNAEIAAFIRQFGPLPVGPA
jgi:hypothetical protein